MSGRRIAGWIGLLTLAAVAVVAAQSYPRWGGTLTGIANYDGNQFSTAFPFPVTGTVATTPAATTPPIKGFGNLVGTGASAPLSTLTTGPNSAAWPTSPGMITVITTGGVGYVCALGGTCSASAGIPIGSSIAGWSFYQPSTDMTVYAPIGVTFTAVW